ncbi:MAG TPA: glycine cleavage system aminomethyltransferase GcvT [Mycobacteriales bacterium]|nr:glycine cleavage system aminomethyltransferase GcvT [Mycobacteriales bacterium]
MVHSSAPDAAVADPRSLFRSPLHERHLALGAKMANFGGWEMPIEYPRDSGGVLAEHTAVRTGVGIFDVSHLGKGVVRGHRAVEFVNDCLTADLRRLVPGQAQYTLCCDEASGGVVDDLIAYLRADEEVFLVPNAANTAEVVRRLGAVAPAHVEVEDLHHKLGVIAVQGPDSDDLLEAVGLPTDHEYMSFVPASWNERPVVVCRSGYTGERGYELLPRWEDTGDLWDALMAAGAEFSVRPCGLGARDTLRTEMGYPLHGQDLSLSITPVQARATWAVGWDKPRFWGRDVLLAEKQRGPHRLLWGLLAQDRSIPRPHMAVASTAGDPLGEVTSGTFSPTRKVGIGLALLDRGVTEGDTVHLDVRGRTGVFQVVRPPFVKPSTR